MLRLVLVLIGFAFMVYSTVVSFKIFYMFNHPKERLWFSFGGRSKKQWTIFPFFILSFMLFYLVYIVLFLRENLFDYELVSALILLFGAMFVSILVSMNHSLFRKLKGEK